jgi:hypothetical protein
VDIWLETAGQARAGGQRTESGVPDPSLRYRVMRDDAHPGGGLHAAAFDMDPDVAAAGAAAGAARVVQFVYPVRVVVVGAVTGEFADGAVAEAVRAQSEPSGHPGGERPEFGGLVVLREMLPDRALVDDDPGLAGRVEFPGADDTAGDGDSRGDRPYGGAGLRQARHRRSSLLPGGPEDGEPLVGFGLRVEDVLGPGR